MKTNKTLDELKQYVDTSRLDINARVQMIIDDVQKQLDKYEQEARSIYFPESINKPKTVEIDKENSATPIQTYDDIPPL